jgi:chaperonin GroES
MTFPLKPLEYFVVVEPIEVEHKTSGGLFIPEDTADREGFARREGILVAMSPAAFRGIEGWPDDAPTPQIGDRVLFPKYQAEEWKNDADGKTYWLMRDRTIIGVIGQ